LQAAISGSGHIALEKHMPHTPDITLQCFAERLVQSVSAAHPHEWVAIKHAGPAFIAQSTFSSHPHVWLERHLPPIVLAMQSSFVLHPQKFPA
jgi:hypothetical protein